MKPDDGYWQKTGVLIELMRSHWGEKTLESFRLESDKRPDGGLWEAIRPPGGSRMAIMVCVTKPDDVAMFEKAFSLEDDGESDDWTSTTMLDLFMGSKDHEAGFSCQRDKTGRRSALIFLVHSPRTVAFIEKIFGLAP